MLRGRQWFWLTYWICVCLERIHFLYTFCDSKLSISVTPLHVAHLFDECNIFYICFRLSHRIFLFCFVIFFVEYFFSFIYLQSKCSSCRLFCTVKNNILSFSIIAFFLEKKKYNHFCCRCYRLLLLSFIINIHISPRGE